MYSNINYTDSKILENFHLKRIKIKNDDVISRYKFPFLKFCKVQCALHYLSFHDNPFNQELHFIIIDNFKLIKSVSYSSQGSHTGQLDFCNWLADSSTTG